MNEEVFLKPSLLARWSPQPRARADRLLFPEDPSHRRPNLQDLPSLLLVPNSPPTTRPWFFRLLNPRKAGHPPSSPGNLLQLQVLLRHPASRLPDKVWSEGNSDPLPVPTNLLRQVARQILTPPVPTPETLEQRAARPSHNSLALTSEELIQKIGIV